MLKNAKGEWVQNPVHVWFGLSYANYFVMPRMAMEAMPLDWQERFVALFGEMYELGVEPPTYHVLRAEPEYTHTVNEDPDDPTSWAKEFTILQTDPWSQYRHPDRTLLPEALRGKEE